MSWLSTGVRRGSAGAVGRRQAEPLGRSVGQGAAVGTAAELPRTTSCTGYGAGLATPSPRTKARIAAPTGAPLTAGPYPAGPAPRSAAETPPAHCTDDTRRWAAVAESILPPDPARPSATTGDRPGSGARPRVAEHRAAAPAGRCLPRLGRRTGTYPGGAAARRPRHVGPDGVPGLALAALPVHAHRRRRRRRCA